MKQKTIAFDIDGTLCDRPEEYEYLGPEKYLHCTPNQEMIDALNLLHDKGHRIIIYTSRGMGQFNGDVNKCYKELYDITFNSLIKWGVKFENLIMGKIAFDVLIDNNAIGVDDLDKIKNL